MSAESTAEMALINLAFAQAELELSGASSAPVMSAMDHISKAISNLKRLAPGFDCPVGSDEPKAAISA
jgi:hypothetical protein